jgi:phage gp29-like protein
VPNRSSRLTSKGRAKERAPAKAPPKAPPNDVGSAFPDQSLWEQFSRIGGNVTPLQVSGFIREADEGRPAQLIDFANECRQKDGHLQSVLFTREAALAGLDWKILNPLDRGGSWVKRKRAPKGERERRFIEDVFRGLDAPKEDRDAVGLRELIQHLTGGPFYGHAVGENLMTVDRHGRQVPRGFALHAARRFGFSRARGELVFRPSNYSALQEVDFRAENPFSFIVSQPRITGDVPAREGLMRVVVWAALFRTWTVGDLMKLAEFAWKGLRLGKYKKGTSKEDIAQLERIVRLLTSSGAATHSEDVEVDVKWPEGARSGSGHLDLHSRLAGEISKAVIGQTLTTEVGNSGSRALGDVHDKVRRDILEYDAKHVAMVITRDVIRPLIELNFGPDAIVPVFAFVTDEAADIKKTAEGIEILQRTGMKIPEGWAHNQVGVPQPAEGEPVLVKPGTEPTNDDAKPEPQGDDKPQDEAA